MRKFVTLFFSFLLAAQAWAFDFTAVYNGKTLYYDIINDAEVRLTSQNSSTTTGNPYYNSNTPVGDVEIPSTVTNTNDGKTYTVTQISNSAFAYCNELTSVTIPNTVTSIGSNSFVGCTSLTSINVEINNTAYTSENGILFNKAKTELIRYPAGKTETTYTFPASVTSIVNQAFRNCANLTSITIPSSVTSIGETAFCDCTGLTSVAFATPSSVTSIPKYAFYRCGNLTTITIPNSVTSIGTDAFDGCSSLNYNIYENGKYLGNNGNSYFALITVTDKNIKTFSINESCNVISDAAFKGCYTLASIAISNSVTSIGNSAFYGCSTLTAITIPNSVTSIGSAAFSGCNTLTTVTFATPCLLSSISSNAFYGCSALASVSIPESVTSIDEYAFAYCHNLKSVTIPKTVTSIGSAAFGRCDIATFYCECEETAKPTGWNSSYNTQTKWGCKVIRAEVNNSEYGNVSIAGSNVAATGYNGSLWYLKETTNGTASLTATPAEHYTFVKWNDGNTENPRNFTVTENKNFTAIFAPKHVVTVNAEHGTVSGDGEYAQGATATIEVTPNHGYVFAGWADDETAPNPRTVTVNSDLELTALFDPFIYEITATAAANGTVEGGGSYAYLTTATLTTKPNDHYYFDHWNSDSDDDENPLTIEVTDNAAYTATFAYGPRITYSAEHGTVEGVGTYKPGKTVLLTAVPDAGYYFVKWGDNVTANPRSEVAPASNAADVSFTAIFAKGKTISVSGEHGSVNGAGSYKEGSTVTLTAVPDEGYHFVAWGDGVNTASREVTVNDDMEFSVTFEINSYTVTANATNGTVEGGGAYTHGQEATLSATGATGYYFVKWSDNSTDNPHTITVTDNVNISATFSNMYSINVTNISNGSVTGAGEYAYGAEATLKATAASGYHFVRWSDGNKDNPRTITVSANLELSPVFSDKYEVKLIAKGKGKVSGGGEFDKDEEITIKAIANDHYHFVKWSDGEKQAKRTITVTEDLELTATFDADKFEISVKKTDGGKITGADTYTYDEEVTLKAVPDAGYMFVKWSDGETKNPRTITVTGDQTYSAEFAPAKYTVNIEVENGTVTGAGNDFAYGAEATLTATPADGYKFVKWSDGNTDNPRTVTITEDLALTAVFEAITAIDESEASAVSIYTTGNVIVVENANSAISVYDAMGRLVGMDATPCVRAEINVNAAGVYIVKVGNTAKRVMINE